MDTIIIKNKWSSGVRGVMLAVVIVVAASVGIGALCLAGVEQEHHIFANVVLPVLLSVTLIVLLLCWPVGIAVGNDRLKLMRPWRSVVIERRAVVKIRRFHREEVRGFVRVRVGCSWIGYWGWFWDPQTGWFMMHTLGGSDLLLIELRNGKKYVVENNEATRAFLDNSGL